MASERKGIFAILVLGPCGIAHELDQSLQLIRLCGQKYDLTILTLIDAHWRKYLAPQAGGDSAQVTIEVHIQFHKGRDTGVRGQIDVFPCSRVERAKIGSQGSGGR
jgi:hypothetical protein